MYICGMKLETKLSGGVYGSNGRWRLQREKRIGRPEGHDYRVLHMFINVCMKPSAVYSKNLFIKYFCLFLNYHFGTS